MATAVVKAEQAEAQPVHKSNSRGASPQPLGSWTPRHRRDTARRRGGAGSSPLDGASTAAFSTVRPTQCDFHTGDNLQMRQAGDFRGSPLRLPARVRQVRHETGPSRRLRVVSTRRAVDASPSRRRRAASAGTARSGTAACGASSAARRRRSDSGPRFLSCALCSVRPCSTTSTPPPRPRRDGVSRSYF